MVLAPIAGLRAVASPTEWEALEAMGDGLRGLADLVAAATAAPAPDRLVARGARWLPGSDPTTSSRADGEPITVAGWRDAMAAGRASCAELMAELVARTDAAADLGVYICFDGARAIEEAQHHDAARAAGHAPRPLAGVPIAVKDLLTTADFATTAQSRVPDAVGAQRVDAPAVARLRRAGAIVTGKTTLLEYACGLHDPATGFPEPRNPWDPQRWPGGSSSGAAAGIAAALFPAALGTDTGGSIRVPAAYCGVTGFKPTIGVVPTRGCVPFAPSLDHVGPLARTAADCARVFAALAGVEFAPVSCGDLRVGYLADAVADDEISGLLSDAMAVVATITASVRAASVPLLQALFAAGSVVIAAESFAWHRDRLATCWADYGASVRVRLATGALMEPDAYAAALRLLHQVAAGLTTTAFGADVLALPTSDVVAPPLDTLGDPRALGATPRFTIPWSALGLPSVSVPVGLTAAGLPVGLQFVGPFGADDVVLALAAEFQRRTVWHTLTPGAIG